MMKRNHKFLLLLLVLPLILACAIPLDGLGTPTPDVSAPTPFVLSTPTAYPTLFAQTSDFVPAHVVINVAGLFIRADKSEDAHSFIIAPAGAELMVVPTDEVWWQVCYTPMEQARTSICGYSNSNYIEVEGQ